MNRDELDLEREHLDLLDALDAAKQAHRAKPTDKTKAALLQAKTDIQTFRGHWRTVRAAFNPTPGTGVAAPETIQRTVKGG
jgi:hypothetical protein